MNYHTSAAFRLWRRQLQDQGHRGVVYISVSPFADHQGIALANEPNQFRYRARAFERQQLPQSITLSSLVFDLLDGWHPDHLATLVGCLQGGALLIIIGPPLGSLYRFQDPQYSHMSPWPRISPWHTHYLRNIAQSLSQGQHASNPWVYELQSTPAAVNVLVDTLSAEPQHSKQHSKDIHSHQAAKSPTHSQTVTAVKSHSYLAPEPDQRQCIEQYNTTWRASQAGHATPWLLLQGDRGLGKTTSFLLWLEQLLPSLTTPITIAYLTARDQQQTPWREWQRQNRELIKIHTLLCSASQALTMPMPQLICIDEIASWPLNQLTDLLQRFNTANQQWLLLLGSMDGYEGSARALAHMPWPRPIQRLALTQSKRWQGHDQLSHWIQTSCLARTHWPVQSISKSRLQLPSQPVLIPMEFDTLIEQNQWFSLMATAHYRTRPSDLRVVLDAPNQYLYGLWDSPARKYLLGGLWLSGEGPIAEHLQLGILRKQRRLRSQFAPQYVANYWLSQAQPDQAKYALDAAWIRIVRIAIAPAWQTQGLGRQLVMQAMQRHPNAHFAVSFKPNSSTSAFWQQLAWQQLSPSFYLAPSSY